jgi:alpha-mannosidase
MRFCASTLTAILALTISPGAGAQTSEKRDLSQQPTLYVVGYAHLDTEWRWEYPQVINEYIRKTMEDNFKLFDKYPHYVFNFSGANRYRLMKEYFPEDFAKLKRYVDEGKWFPAGSSMEEGDVNAPNAEAIIRQILYGNDWFRQELGTASAEYMLPDCFGFPSSLPTILAHSGVKGFSTQKLVWGSSAPGGGPESIEKTPEGTPFNVGVWVGPDGESVLAGLNPGSYSGGIETDLSKPLTPLPANATLEDIQKRLQTLRGKIEEQDRQNKLDPNDLRQYYALRTERDGFRRAVQETELDHYQEDWASRVRHNGEVSGLFADYHYYGTGDTGGTPDEDSVRRLEAIVTKGTVELPPPGQASAPGQPHPQWPQVKVGDGPVHVISANAEQMFLDITPAQAKGLPRYTGEMELTNHSAGSLTSQAYQKRWLRKEELLADAAEKSSIAAEWLGARPYPLERLNNAWTLEMGGHFHDIAAGTATPKSYEFAWNDDVIAMNQFAGVLTSASEGVAAALNTQTKGIPIVVFNTLNIDREDVVEAAVTFPEGMPKAVHVSDPHGNVVPAQVSNGKVLFSAKVPSIGYAVYDVQAGAVEGKTQLRVSANSLENQYYLVKLNSQGDVSSIYDKSLGKELLAGPVRLAISYDNPQQWPAWNMDWDQEQAPPKAYVSGPAKIRIIENGPVRVALEVSHETLGSSFVQVIRLSAGDAGKRVEFGNIIDWNTRESNLKATFPLSASNRMATYNWDIGTIERPTAEPRKFEVPSHQWIDLTDMSDTFGTTILTDCKNGSDKPTDNAIRLTLIRTPGTRGGYADQGTQDIGHHEFIFGLAGHSSDWRASQTDWQGQRLNDALIAFETSKHTGALNREFSLLKVSNSRVRVLALKKAEHSDEVVLRMVELDGKPQPNVKISFAAPVSAAREVNGQEQPIGSATVTGGSLVTSFSAYQPRTFAIKLAAAVNKIGPLHSTPVELQYDLATTTTDHTHSAAGFDGKGNSLPAEMLPTELTFSDVKFQLAPAKSDVPNAVVAKGQTINLPAGRFDHLYILAAAANGDQKAAFEVGGNKVELNIQDWGGFVGQWDDRQWSKSGADDDYGDMTGLKPGYIKRANLAWYCSHHHNAAGENVPYSYSYLFAYMIDLPAGANSIKLPDNDKVRVLAMSAAVEGPVVRPVQSLYDVLPPPKTGDSDFLLSSSTPRLSFAQGSSASTKIVMTPRNGFANQVIFAASGVPSGVTASFDPASSPDATTLKLRADSLAKPGHFNVTIEGISGSLSHSSILDVSLIARKQGSVPVDMSSAYNTHGIYQDGSKFSPSASLDGGGFAFSAQLLGSTQPWNGVSFKLGPPNTLNAVTSRDVALPAGRFLSLNMLATAVGGNQEDQFFTIRYEDGSHSDFTQSLSDWYTPGNFLGEFPAVKMPYRIMGNGGRDDRIFYLYAYSFDLDPGKVVRSLSLPDNKAALVFAISLEPALRRVP